MLKEFKDEYKEENDGKEPTLRPKDLAKFREAANKFKLDICAKNVKDDVEFYVDISAGELTRYLSREEFEDICSDIW